MKLMTYNIFDGGEDRLSLIKEIVRDINPDYLTINEANGFSDNNNRILNKFAEDLEFKYFDLALCGEYDYHVAVFSKKKFTLIKKLQPLQRACIITSLETDIGTLSIASLHLTPDSEDLRNGEIDLIIENQKNNNIRILTGDMNSLSRYDEYKKSLIKDFNETQLRKFTTNEEFRFDAIDKILSSDYIDVAVELGENSDSTVPTPANEDDAHSKMRLDYFFVSDLLKSKLISYSVIKNNKTDKASDHYPIVMDLENL